MKFYSYTNNNNNYTKAISLENILSVEISEYSGKSAIRFIVNINYINKEKETFSSLEKEEAKKVYNEILSLLNKED